MRITGYGTGFGQQSDNRDRAAAFRAKHSIGQRIKGRILRREPGGLFWVQADGEELLARLEAEAQPGDQLLFIVRALTPEIMLQVLTGGMTAGDLPGLVQRFRAAREVFEVRDSDLMEVLSSTPPQPELRHEVFWKALATQPESTQRFANVQNLLSQINTSLAPEQHALALYEPWLLPRQRRQEMLRHKHQENVTETNLSAVDMAAGAFEARLLTGSDSTRLILSAEKPGACGALQVELAALVRSEHQVEPAMLGPTQLRQNNLGGVLGALFGEVPAWTSGGLNTRV